MRRAEPPVLITAEEAARLGAHCPNFPAVYDLVRRMVEARGRLDIVPSCEWAVAVLFCDIYNAGRISGIRQERRRERGEA